MEVNSQPGHCAVKGGFPQQKMTSHFFFLGVTVNFQKKEISSSPTMVDTVRKPTHMKNLKYLQDIVTDTIGVRDVTHSVGMITPVSNVQESIQHVSVRRKEMLVTQEKLIQTSIIQPTMKQSPPLPTPVKFEQLDKYLDGFDGEKREILRAGFRDGFKIFFNGEDWELDCLNSKAA